MFKILIRSTRFMIAAANVIMLITIPSCVTPTSPGAEQIEAARQIFPAATGMTEITISRHARTSGYPGNPKISEIKGPSGLLGYWAESEGVSRSGPFKIRVLLDPQLYVKQAAVISYPGDRGRDVYKRAFTSQFEGKGPQDSIQIGKDIDAITGATISSRAMAEAIRNTIKLIKLMQEKQFKSTGKLFKPLFLSADRY